LFLNVTEIFKSIQGESTHAGRLCTFVRLGGCNLRCAYCDTPFAQQGGRRMSMESVLRKVNRLQCGLVEITGGEPLMQEGTVFLIQRLLKRKYQVMLETNGSLDISVVPQPVIRIVDIKTPSSKMQDKMYLDNFNYLTPQDEVKFVIMTRVDYTYAKRMIKKHNLDKRFTVLVSPEAKKGAPGKIAAWCLKDNLNVRLNLQLHKIIWPGQRRGV
jgi:7-carboxy-7-deazaguanine synthase